MYNREGAFTCIWVPKLAWMAPPPCPTFSFWSLCNFLFLRLLHKKQKQPLRSKGGNKIVCGSVVLPMPPFSKCLLGLRARLGSSWKSCPRHTNLTQCVQWEEDNDDEDEDQAKIHIHYPFLHYNSMIWNYFSVIKKKSGWGPHIDIEGAYIVIGYTFQLNLLNLWQYLWLLHQQKLQCLNILFQNIFGQLRLSPSNWRWFSRVCFCIL